MTQNTIYKTYKMLQHYHDKYLKRHAVKLPNLKNHNEKVYK